METHRYNNISPKFFKGLSIDDASNLMDETSNLLEGATIAFFKLVSDNIITDIPSIKIALKDNYITNLNKSIELLKWKQVKDLERHTLSNGKVVSYGNLANDFIAHTKALENIFLAVASGEPPSGKDTNIYIKKGKPESDKKYEETFIALEMSQSSKALIAHMLTSRNICEPAKLCAQNIKLIRETDALSQNKNKNKTDIEAIEEDNLSVIEDNLFKLKKTFPQIELSFSNNKLFYLSDLEKNNHKFVVLAMDTMFKRRSLEGDKLQEDMTKHRNIDECLAGATFLAEQYTMMFNLLEQMKKEEAVSTKPKKQLTTRKEQPVKRTYVIDDSVPELNKITPYTSYKSEWQDAKEFATIDIKRLQKETYLHNTEERLNFQRSKVISDAVKTAFKSLDSSSPWQGEIADKLFNKTNITDIADALTISVKELEHTSKLSEIDEKDNLVRSGISNLLSSILNDKSKKRKGHGGSCHDCEIEVLNLISQHQESLLSGIVNNSLPETLNRIPEFKQIIGANPGYEKALHELTFEQLEQNIEAMKKLKESAILTIFAYGDEAAKDKASAHFMVRVTQEKNLDSVGKTTFSGIMSDMLNAKVKVNA